MKFNKEDFYKSKDELIKLYKLLGSGTEGYVFEADDEIVAKKFHYARGTKETKIQKEIELLDLTNIMKPVDYLMKDDRLDTMFIEKFDGVNESVAYTSFDVLINGTKKIIHDIRLLSECNIIMGDFTSLSIMYNDKDMVLIDTTKYYKEDNDYDRVYKSNLSLVFHTILNELLYKYDINYDVNFRQMLNNHLILKQLQYDYENYNYFFEELRKYMENTLECQVFCINDGFSKLKSNKNVIK